MFEEYLLKRDIRIPEPMIKAEEILNDEEKLARIGAMCKEYGAELKLMIEARISPMREYLLLNAIPQEVQEVRYAILEVAQLIADAQRYSIAYENMQKAIKERKENAVAEVVATETL